TMEQQEPTRSSKSRRGSLLRRQSLIEQIGKPLNLFFNMILRLFSSRTCLHQTMLDFYTPVEDCLGFRIQLFFLGHDVSPYLTIRRSVARPHAKQKHIREHKKQSLERRKAFC